jgi:hypothetical protein
MTAPMNDAEKEEFRRLNRERMKAYRDRTRKRKYSPRLDSKKEA